jgi:hypothetical protein
MMFGKSSNEGITVFMAFMVSHRQLELLREKEGELLEFFGFFVFGDFAAVLAEFVKLQFFRSFHLIFGRDVISVFTNRTDET